MENQEEIEKEKQKNNENENKIEEEKREIKTRTDYDQYNIEERVLKLFEEAGISTKECEDFKGEAKYFRLAHYNFAKKLITSLPGGY